MPKHTATIANAIRFNRRAAKLTQAELAARSNLSRNYICQIENGRMSPTISAISDIAAAIGIPVERIIGDDHVIRELRQVIDKTNAQEVLANLKKIIRKLS